MNTFGLLGMVPISMGQACSISGYSFAGKKVEPKPEPPGVLKERLTTLILGLLSIPAFYFLVYT